MGQQVCLRWNNFQSSLTTTLENLWDEETFCDVTLFCEGQEIRAHKVVLSACSLVFRNLLKNNACQHPIIILQDTSLSVLEGILQFIYKGEVNIEQDQLHDLLRAATSLQIKGLAGVNYRGTEEGPEAPPSKKPKKSSCNNITVENDKLNPKRKKARPSSSEDHEEFVPVKEEPTSEDDEECNNQASNIDVDNEREDTDLDEMTRREDIDFSQDEDPLMRQPANASQDTNSPVELLPNPSKALTCSNTQCPPYPCPFCCRAYASWGFRRRHIKAIHTVGPQLTCKWCSSVLVSREDWENHVISEHHLSRSEAEQGLTVLEEAHMVLQTTNVVTDVFKEVIDRSPVVKE